VEVKTEFSFLEMQKKENGARNVHALFMQMHIPIKMKTIPKYIRFLEKEKKLFSITAVDLSKL
jgi:hypothetical protein